MKKIITTLATAAVLASCASNQQPKTLVLYYSQEGSTEAAAQEIKAQLGADIELLEVENPYNGTYAETIARCQSEMASGILPTLKPIKANLKDYDVIFLGYPIWFGTYAPPVAALLKSEAFAGKKVVTFCSFGSGGLQASTKAIANALPQAEVVEGYGVRAARVAAIPAEVERFLIEAGFKEGEVEALPAFMEHHPVDEAEVEVFNQACGDYQMPLGTPVDVAVRETSNSTDYEFKVDNGSTIYVVAPKNGSKPEFTQVVR